MNLRELVWPLLERNPTREAQRAAEVVAYVSRIRATNWANNASAILAEGQRLAEAEADRRRSADNKAAIYLAAVAAIVPLLASTETVFFDNTPASAPRWATVLPLVLALAYLSGTALWAVRTLRVTAVCRVDVETLFEPRGPGGVTNHLAKEYLVSAMLNRAVANDKITKLKMTHEFILRAAVTFTTLLALEAGWAPVKCLINFLLCRV